MSNDTYVLYERDIRFYNPKSCTTEGVAKAVKALESRVRKGLCVEGKFGIKVKDKYGWGYGVYRLQFDPNNSTWILYRYFRNFPEPVAKFNNTFDAVVGTINMLGYDDSEYELVDAE